MKKVFLQTVTVLLIVMGSLNLFAQTRIITGTVKDSQGDAIIGASILVKGTTVGTYSDANGGFSVAVTADAKTLVVRYLGMKTQEIALGASNTLDVKMEDDVLGLDEVVVTALGISKEKKSLGYSTQVVGSDQINKSGSGNVLSELSGKVSGLTVINSGGTPGSGTYLQLRGITSLTGSNQPLIIVDGIRMDNSTNGYDATSGNSAFLNPVGGTSTANRGIDIDPSDIASINVLKGPAACALYGIDAASGAIIITTKKGGGSGTGPGPHIEFTTSRTIDKVNKFPDLQNQWGQGSNGNYRGPETGSSTSWGPSIDTLSWDGDNTYAFDSHGAVVGNSDPAAKTAFTPYDNVGGFFINGSTFNNNLALSGGNNNNGYRVSIGNVHQNGIVPLSTYDKSTLSLSGQSNLTNKFSISGTVTYVKSNTSEVQQGSNVSGLMLGLLRTPITFDNANGSDDPANDTVSYVMPDGTQRNYRAGGGYDNPYWTVNRNPYTAALNRVYGSVEADYKIEKWLSLSYRVGGDIYSQNNKQAYDIGSRAFTTGLIYLDNYTNQQFSSDLFATLQKDFNKDWAGSLTLGHNYFTLNSARAFSQGTGFVIPQFYDMLNAGSVLASEAEAMKRTMAFYGSGELSYKSMLYLTLTGRKETSSTLPEKNNSFFYPSANLGFVFTEPLNLSNSKVLPYGKLRLSYAQVGKDAPIQATQTYFYPTSFGDGFTPGDQFPINGINGYSIAVAFPFISALGNPELKPEKTNSLEAGVDLAFVQNRVSVSATYFSEKTTDAIFSVPISYASGWGATVKNAGVLTNKGFELTLNTTPLKTKSGLRWDVNFNWSTYKNLVVELSPGIDNLLIAGFQNGAIYALAGQPFGVIYGTDYVKTSDGTIVINDNPGDPGYGMPIPGSKNLNIGNTQPKWIGSVASDLSFKGFKFGFQINVRHGGQIWNGTRGALSYFGRSAETENRGDSTVFSGVMGHLDLAGNVVHYDTDGVTEVNGAGPDNSYKSAYNQYYWQNIGSSFIGPTSPSVEDGSYVRLSQVSLSYELPKSVLKNSHLYSLSITLFANNPKLWTKYSGVDPETSLVGPINGQGLDYFNMPGMKSFGARLTLGI